jgi:predicted site-specific integrase-resolvase
MAARTKDFREALAAVGLTPETFAERAGIHRTTVYRWLRSGDVPPWAWWLVLLLRERQEIAARLSRPID